MQLEKHQRAAAYGLVVEVEICWSNIPHLVENDLIRASRLAAEVYLYASTWDFSEIFLYSHFVVQRMLLFFHHAE